MQKLNFTLELINGSVSILLYFLLVFLIHYLVTIPRRITLKTLFISSTAASLVVSVLIEHSGNLITRCVIWIWRMHGGDIPFTLVQTTLLVIGSFGSAMGLLLMIRVLSRPSFGNWPWVIAATVTLTYDLAALISRTL